MMKRYLMVAALAVVLAGCGTTKHDPAIQPTTATQSTGGQGSSNVTPVQTDNLSGANAQGPVGVNRVVLFDFDSYVVKPEYQGLIEQHARFLRANPSRGVSLEGHTDERGSREYNLALGQKRAEAVRHALTLVGASDSQLEAVSFGEEKPAVEGHTEAAWSQNRRVELRYR